MATFDRELLNPPDFRAGLGGPHAPELPLKRQTGHVWHYTSADGLLGIVGSNELWASSPRVLNDLSEIEYGWNQMKATWKDLRSSDLPSTGVAFVDEVLQNDLATAIQGLTYVTSGSLDSDLLNQWMHYSHVDGFAIGVSANGFWGPKNRLQETGRDLPVAEGWHDVIYAQEQQTAVTRAVLCWAATLWGGPDQGGQEEPSTEAIPEARYALQSLLLQLKHPAFSAEKEARYIVARAEGDLERYRVSEGRLIPYMSISSTSYVAPPEGTAKITLPIVGVVCGPGTRPGTDNIVRDLLASSGFHDVAIGISEAPYSSR